MQDDSIGKRNNDANDDDFSLNKFDVMDEDLNESKVRQADRLDAFDTAFEDDVHASHDETDSADKQEPSIPGWFDAGQEDRALDDVLPETAAVGRSFSSSSPSPSPSAADQGEPVVAPVIEHLQEDSLSASQPTQQAAGSRMIVLSVVVILLVAIIAWFIMASSEEDLLYQQPQAVLADDVQMQRMDKKISSLREQVTGLQKRLLLQEQQIAALTHLLAEQSRQQKKVIANKPVLKKLTSKKPVQKKTKAVAASVIKKQAMGWTIVVASVNTRSAAERALKSLKGKGIAAEISPIVVKGKPWYRIYVGGFASKQEAQAKKAYLLTRHGLRDAWLHRAK